MYRLIHQRSIFIVFGRKSAKENVINVSVGGESPEFDLASHSLPVPIIPLYFNASLYSALFYTL